MQKPAEMEASETQQAIPQTVNESFPFIYFTLWKKSQLDQVLIIWIFRGSLHHWFVNMFFGVAHTYDSQTMSNG